MKERHHKVLKRIVSSSEINPEKQAMPKKLFDFIAEEQELDSKAKSQPLLQEEELINVLRSA
jgi:hypothetical protein